MRAWCSGGGTKACAAEGPRCWLAGGHRSTVQTARTGIIATLLVVSGALMVLFGLRALGVLRVRMLDVDVDLA